MEESGNKAIVNNDNSYGNGVGGERRQRIRK
jgi:hypothetical protein